jgi:peptidoglycan-associated lipoprotein
MRKVAGIATAVAAMAALTACASRPEPAPPPVEAPPPPAPTPARKPVATPAPRGPVPGSLEDFKVSVGERVFFDYDQSSLRADARATLDRQAAWLRRYGAVRIRVAGHADERGTREYNLALGARRASAVKDYLVSLGITADRLETVSFGEERPLDPRPNEEGWAINRNAHTVITAGAIS